MASTAKRLLVGLVTCCLVVGMVSPAIADPVQDALAVVDAALHCKVWADEPGGNPVVGSGGGVCNVGQLPVVVTVCLDYNGVTIASSCRVYRGTGGASGSSNPTICLPGLWQTQVTMSHILGPESRTHSDPVLLLCIPPV